MNAINEIIETKLGDHEFKYNLLGRLKQDCEYYLGNGGRHAKHLWAGNEQEQIDSMRALHNSLNTKPEWLTLEQIAEYETAMVSK